MACRCDHCGGKGKVVKDKCPSCQGRKVKRGSNQFTVQIEQGMWDGQELVYEGEADQSPDYSAGNVVYKLRVQSHPVFRREGDHLYVTQVLSLRQGLLGFNTSLVHLSGETLVLSRQTPTQHGTRDSFHD